MIFVMPMAGRGERFASAGYALPKPLIPIDGVPMFVKATNSLPLSMASRVVFAVLQEHVESFGLDSVVHHWFGHVPLKIVVLPSVTSGQAETVACALEGERPDGPVVIFNADSSFEDDDLESYFESISSSVAGVVQVFRDTDSRWSFVRCESQGLRIVETAEKQPISDMACTGLYYFRTAAEYLELYKNMDLSHGEKYVAPMYNLLIRREETVLAKPVARYFCFGTPADYDACVNRGRVYKG